MSRDAIESTFVDGNVFEWCLYISVEISSPEEFSCQINENVSLKLLLWYQESGLICAFNYIIRYAKLTTGQKLFFIKWETPTTFVKVLFSTDQSILLTLFMNEKSDRKMQLSSAIVLLMDIRSISRYKMFLLNAKIPWKFS